MQIRRHQFFNFCTHAPVRGDFKSDLIGLKWSGKANLRDCAKHKLQTWNRVMVCVLLEQNCCREIRRVFFFLCIQRAIFCWDGTLHSASSHSHIYIFYIPCSPRRWLSSALILIRSKNSLLGESSVASVDMKGNVMFVTPVCFMESTGEFRAHTECFILQQHHWQTVLEILNLDQTVNSFIRSDDEMMVWNEYTGASVGKNTAANFEVQTIWRAISEQQWKSNLITRVSHVFSLWIQF